MFERRKRYMQNTRTVFNRLFAILMLLVTLFTTTIVANAETTDAIDEDITLYYSTIGQNTTSFSISGIKATCSTTMISQYSTTLKIKMELQKKKSDGYETVATWTSSKTGTSIAMSESRNINVLCTYRLKATFTAGSETAVVYKYAS
jgi:hypothetical protein